MEMTALSMSQIVKPEISYAIYTIERLPKGSRRTPKWDLHSTANDRETAMTHAKILSAQTYFDHVEVQEFRVCPDTQERKVAKICSYSRKSKRLWWIGGLMLAAILAALILL
jgi:recombinational DNA repair protein RecR